MVKCDACGWNAFYPMVAESDTKRICWDCFANMMIKYKESIQREIGSKKEELKVIEDKIYQARMIEKMYEQLEFVSAQESFESKKRKLEEPEK